MAFASITASAAGVLAGGAVPATAASTTAVAAAIGVLVADGASPTQAHVTTLNNAWTTLLAAIVAVNGSIASADATLVINQANVTTRKQMQAIFASILQSLSNLGIAGH